MEQLLWTEKYRPKTIADTILPEDLKTTFQKFVDNKHIPNLLLAGPPGIGKTTVAKAMLEELGCDYIIINGSLNGNIDTLRNEIMQFASSVSFSGGRKYVILDEADYLNPNSTQPALRNFMEEYSKNCGFILTCNFINRIIDPLHSRCSVVKFGFSTADAPKLLSLFFKRTCYVLDQENIEYDKQTVAALIKKHFPDWRRVINELQRYSAGGKIDSGILTSLSDDNFKELVGYLKAKSFMDMRKWCVENSDSDSSIFRKLYDASVDILKPNSIPQLVLIIAESQYKAAFVADPEINLVACLTNVMVECEFK
jgi:DNA polymerase III delta prime subunit